MSLNHMNAAWEIKDVKGTQKIVLLRLAYHADKDTGECFPKYDSLMAYCGVNLRQLKQHLLDLENHGFIKILRSNRKPSTFRLTLLAMQPTAHLDMQPPAQPRASRYAENCTARYAENGKTAMQSTASPYKGRNDNRELSKEYIAAAPAAKTKPAPEKLKQRDLLFDAIAEVCCLDMAAQGNLIGKAKKKLLEFKATPDEVRLFGKVYAKQHPVKQVPQWTELSSQFGIVRNKTAIDRILGGAFKQKSDEETGLFDMPALGGKDWV